jgi:histidine triad (HIT) family protein
MDQQCIFCRIGTGDVPAELLYRDRSVFAIKDIAPRAPTHILVIPIEHYTDIAGSCSGSEQTLGRLIHVAGTLAKSQGLSEKGYRLVINQGDDGGQTVSHLHMHLLGGRRLGPEG